MITKHNVCRMVFGLTALIAASAASANPQTYTLKATPETVVWGNYSASAKPVLRIHSGDTVIFETLLTNSPTGLEANGVPPDQVVPGGSQILIRHVGTRFRVG